MNKKLALSTAISALLYSALAPANVTFNLPDGHTFTVKSATSGNVVLRVSPSGELLVNGQPLTEIVGKEGPQGEPGIPGRTILSGATGPKSSDGIKGDFWLDTELSILYGPKTDAGWGSGVSIVGADGPQGPKGDAGARGATGPAGPQGDKGDTGVAGTSCTVEQVESSAVITCEDGTSAALASAGTVVTYPEGLLGEVPPTNVPTGTIVLVDGEDNILGEIDRVFNNEHYLVSLSGIMAAIINGLDNNVIVGKSFIYGEYGDFYYLDEDCNGAPFTSGSFRSLVWDDKSNTLFAGSDSITPGDVLFRSVTRSAYLDVRNNVVGIGACENRDTILNSPAVLVPYYPANEILNAVYPVRAKQLQ